MMVLGGERYQIYSEEKIEMTAPTARGPDRDMRLNILKGMKLTSRGDGNAMIYVGRNQYYCNLYHIIKK
jgi:hypothetical protein